MLVAVALAALNLSEAPCDAALIDEAHLGAHLGGAVEVVEVEVAHRLLVVAVPLEHLVRGKGEGLG